MNEAAFELLEELTEYVLLHLRTQARKTKPPGRATGIHVRITRIQYYLDKARHEQKGGPS